MQARTILAGCALASFLACVLNYMSPVFLVLVPISLIATIAVLVSIYYKWKRGIEIFIFLSVTLFVIELVVFIVVLATRAEILRFYEMLMYLVGMLVCTASTATAIWVLNQTDYQRAGAERKSLISRFSGNTFPRPHRLFLPQSGWLAGYS